MLVTDQGKMIRTTVGDIRIAGRNTMGVTIFRVAEDEHVVSVAKIDESDEEEIEIEGGEEIAPVDDAVIGESELDKPADPEGEAAAAAAPSQRRTDKAATNAATAPPGPRSPSEPFKEETSMPLPHNALVLVADGRKILFFRNHGDENQIDLRTEAHDERRTGRTARSRPTLPERRSRVPATAARPTRRPTSTSRRRIAGSRRRRRS